MSSRPRFRQVSVPAELPASTLPPPPEDSPAALAFTLRVLWLLQQVRRGELGVVAAARMAPLPLALFLARMAENRISAFPLEDAEMAAEFSPLP